MTLNLSRASWRKSSYSGNGGADCVEVAFVQSLTTVRDSKNPTGPALVFQPGAMTALVDAIKGGQLS